MKIKVGDIWRNKRSGNVVRIDEMLKHGWYVQFSRAGKNHRMLRVVFLARYEPAHCRQCGKLYTDRACGPSHAIVAVSP